MRRRRKSTDRRHETASKMRTGSDRTVLATDAGIAPTGPIVGTGPIGHIVQTGPIDRIVPTDPIA